MSHKQATRQERYGEHPGKDLGLQTQVAVSLSISAAWTICLSTPRNCSIILKITTWAPRKLELQEWGCQWTWKQTGTHETWHTYTWVLQLQTSTGVRFLRFTLMSNILGSCVIWRKTAGSINQKQAIFSLWNKCVLCSKLQWVVHRY